MTGKIEPNAKPLAPFTFNASAEYRWLTEQYFLKCGRGDPDEELSRRLVAYVNHIALQGDAPFDPIASLSADAEAEREAVRLQRAAQIRSSFTKEKADAELRAICENLSCGCEGGGVPCTSGLCVLVINSNLHSYALSAQWMCFSSSSSSCSLQLWERTVY